ncbi:hypothetical protein ANO14919_011400 [Xylariales sp. No.14919]|nr:hypothetical protein ANO14919_011400 [Xylariales sp. No.14919]
MAHGFEPALSFSSSTPNSSPPDVLGDAKIRRRLLRIPNVQKDLLKRHESWASYLSRRPKGFVNVPPDVLDDAKNSYTQQKRVVESHHASGLGSHGGDDIDAPEPSGSQSSAPSCIEDGDENGNQDEHNGELSSWPPSPQSHLRPPRVGSEESNQPFMTQIPEKSSPQPTVVTSPPEIPKLPEFPQSSQGHDDEIEVEIPVALTYSLPPINKSALQVLATPPSAQIVPCTFEQSVQSGSAKAPKKSDPQQKPKPKKHIYNRVPELYRGPKQGATPSHLNTNVGFTGALIAPDHNTDRESSLSTNDTPSSIIPSTTNNWRIESDKHTEVWDIRRGPVSTYDASLSPKSPHSPLVSGRHSPAKIQPVPPRVVQSPRTTTPTAHPAAPPVIMSKSWEAPFVHYTATYPTYNGALRDFITACIYIQLQYRRIRTSLYDDFIRAWAEGYLPYVRDCDEAQPPRKALKAIEWYNEIDDDPLFTSRVVTRQNLQSILNFYPSEVEMARLSLGDFSSQGPNERSGINSRVRPHAQESRMPQASTSAQRSEGEEVAQESVEEAEAKARVSGILPIPQPKIAPFASDKQIPSHRSFSGMETRPVRHKGLTRSLSESTMQKKRVATNELRSEGAKRISQGLTSGVRSRMWSDSGSTVSNPSERPKDTPGTSVAPESTMRKNNGKFVEDPEERRRRRLARHFKKHRDNISSSAPISNTPTSAQKR